MPRKKPTYTVTSKHVPASAKRITQAIVTPKGLDRFKRHRRLRGNPPLLDVRLRNIAPRKYQTLPGRIAIKQVIAEGKPIQQYLAVFDLGGGKPLPGVRGKNRFVNAKHEPLHVRHEIFLHRHGLKRREFGALTFIEETSFTLPNRESFTQNPEWMPRTTYREIEETFDYYLPRIHDPKRFTKVFRELVEIMGYGLRIRFPNHRAFIRAYIEMNRNVRMKGIMKRLDRIPVEINEQTKFKGVIQPAYLKQLRNVLELYRYLLNKAQSYHPQSSTPTANP